MNQDNIKKEVKASINEFLSNNLKRTFSAPFGSFFNTSYKKINQEINEINEVHPLFKKIILKYTNQLDTSNWESVLQTLKIFSEQFKDVNLELKMPVELIVGEFKNENYHGAFNQDKEKNKKLNIRITNKTNLSDLLETLNHEYLHYLDYSENNEEGKMEASSESPVRKECAFLRKFQKSIFFGGNISNLKNSFSIFDLDAAFLKSFTKRTLSENNFSCEEFSINKMVASNISVFHDYLNTTQKFIQNNYKKSIGYNESLYYLHKLFNNVISDLLYNTRKTEKEFFSPDDEHLLLDKKEWNTVKEFVNPMISFFQKEHHLTHHQIEVLLDNFSLNMLKGNFEYEDSIINTKMLEKINAKNVYDLRNIYFTPSLNLFTEKPNGIWLNAIKENYYFPYHSLTTEKLSFSGSSRAPKFISSYYDLVFNKNNHVTFPENLERQADEKELEEIFQQGVVKFISRNQVDLKIKKPDISSVFDRESLFNKIKNISSFDKSVSLTLKKIHK